MSAVPGILEEDLVAKQEGRHYAVVTSQSYSSALVISEENEYTVVDAMSVQDRSLFRDWSIHAQPGEMLMLDNTLYIRRP